MVCTQYFMQAGSHKVYLTTSLYSSPYVSMLNRIQKLDLC